MYATMSSLILSLLLVILSTSGSYALEVETGIGAGYRHDKLNWSIAGNLAGNDPNVLSELKWKVESLALNSDIWVKSNGRTLSNSTRENAPQISSRFVLHLQGGYGQINNGENRDSDYVEDNRTDEYSRSENAADDGYLYDITGTLGWELSRTISTDHLFTITPTIGYSYNVQHLTMTDGVQVIASNPDNLGPIPGLDSRYETEWYGPLVGVKLQYDKRNSQTEQLFSLWFESYYHWIEYQAEGQWNLRTDLAQNPSFFHQATGTGWDIFCGWNYALSTRGSLNAELQYSYRRVDEDGLAISYSTAGTSSATHFNEAEWTKKQLMFGYRYKF